MANSLKKRGQKFLRRVSRVSVKASAEGKEHVKENLIQRFSHIQNIFLEKRSLFKRIVYFCILK